MVEIITVNSGSSGNGYVITCNHNNVTEQLILEAGVKFSYMLKALNFDLTNVVGCLLSHEHSDHSAYIKEYATKQINIYATKGTLTALQLPERFNIHSIIKNKKYAVGQFLFLPFQTEHDAAEPCGFLIDCPDGNRIVFATDTYYVKYKFTNVSVFMIECNYEDKLLSDNIKAGIVNKSVGQRVRKSHMSLSQCTAMLKANDLSQVKRIILIHLSQDNSKSDLFLHKIESETGKLVSIATKNTQITIL